MALLVTDLERGGTPLRVARTARLLATRSIDVQVGCLAPRGPISAELEAAGIPTFACDARGRADVPAVLRLQRLLLRIRPDLVHSTLTHANTAARLAADPLGLPVIGGTATVEVERPLHRALERALAWIDAAHTVGGPTVARFVAERYGLPRSRICIVPPFLHPPPAPLPRDEARRTLGLPAHARLIAWAGRFDPVKRTAWLLDVLECGAPDWQLAVAGDGPALQAFERSAVQRGLSGRVHLLGWQTSLAPLLSAAEILVVPSRTEGMPNVVLEAQACGLPVAGTPIGPLIDLAEAGASVRVAAIDSPKALARLVREMLDDRTLLSALSVQARRWAAMNLRADRAIDILEDLYRRVIAEARG